MVIASTYTGAGRRTVTLPAVPSNAKQRPTATSGCSAELGPMGRGIGSQACERYVGEVRQRTIEAPALSSAKSGRAMRSAAYCSNAASMSSAMRASEMAAVFAAVAGLGPGTDDGGAACVSAVRIFASSTSRASRRRISGATASVAQVCTSPLCLLSDAPKSTASRFRISRMRTSKEALSKH